mmetsp:Transcript_36890/g.55164  ORF Transcript_36890/g.55164 Transcript_36890/m.55164 type:complete len:197 (+) Transcript_36890:3876-4466(+)
MESFSWADREQIEKLKYKETCEHMLRVLSYENRNRKRTKGEIEYKAFLSRPLKFVSAKEMESVGKERSCVEENCELCNGDFARVVVTDEEIKNVGGDILKAIPIPITKEDSDEGVLSPPFYPYSLDDIPHLESSAPVKEQNSNHLATNESRSSRRRDHLYKLSAMKNNLLFIQKYNKGLINPSKDELRKMNSSNQR